MKPTLQIMPLSEPRLIRLCIQAIRKSWQQFKPLEAQALRIHTPVQIQQQLGVRRLERFCRICP